MYHYELLLVHQDTTDVQEMMLEQLTVRARQGWTEIWKECQERLIWDQVAQLLLSVLSFPIAFGWRIGMMSVSSMLCWECVCI